MAYIGLARPVIATYHTEGGKTSYSGGIRFGKAVRIEITPTYEDVSDYGDINDDDEEWECTGAEVTLGISMIPEAAENAVNGHTLSENEVLSNCKDRAGPLGISMIPEAAENAVNGHTLSENEVLSNCKDRASPLGIGVRTRESIDGQTKYVAIWLHNVKVTEEGQSHETRGDSITYTTPSVKGNARPDENGDWRTKKTFGTKEEADAWLDGKAGIE